MPGRIVEATGAAVANRTATAAEIEAAMLRALEEARARGVTEPDELRAAMLEAREALRQ